ncbi:MAG: GNAT family N-acetyltransferase [Planctomycetota bacterium]
MTPQIRPCDSADQLRRYIDTYWRRGHVLAHDDAMFRFTYGTPWVDRAVFPHGISVLGLYEGPRLVGFLGAIVAPYPRPQSYWLALWHVLPELKGGGQGGRLLARMQALAEAARGWIGTFGAGPEALPVYLKRGYAVRAARRWLYAPERGENVSEPTGASECAAAAPAADLHSTEALPGARWLEYRYERHPVFRYDLRPGGIFRTEENAWGRVTHACWLAEEWQASVRAVWEAESRTAADAGRRYILDAWAFDRPGAGWVLAPEDLPSVFHPPEARGNVIYASGRPFLPTRIHKGDCDQDRPNAGEPAAADAVHTNAERVSAPA